VQNWSLSSSILLTCKNFWQITFSRYTFFKLFPRIWNQRKILRFLYSYFKKEIKIFVIMEYIYEYFLEIVECKFARNGFTNWKTFLTNILNLKNIIWHLFAGESHQVVKITVTYICSVRWFSVIMTTTNQKLSSWKGPHYIHIDSWKWNISYFQVSRRSACWFFSSKL
jgi:hypothetical protein